MHLAASAKPRMANSAGSPTMLIQYEILETGILAPVTSSAVGASLDG
jgi:hypothetical protein